MGDSKGSRIASLILRILTFILILISLLINATNTKTLVKLDETKVKFTYKDVYAYRYVVSVAVIGAALTLIQIVRTIYYVVSKSDGTPILDLFSDKILSYLLLSGASAGLGAGIDLKATFKETVFGNFFNSFFDKGNAAAAILLLAFICAAILSILSSLALIRKP